MKIFVYKDTTCANRFIFKEVLVCTTGGHYKFWAWESYGCSCETFNDARFSVYSHYGKIGNKQRTSEIFRIFPNQYNQYHNGLWGKRNEKIKKGYYSISFSDLFNTYGQHVNWKYFPGAQVFLQDKFYFPFTGFTTTVITQDIKESGENISPIRKIKKIIII